MISYISWVICLDYNLILTLVEHQRSKANLHLLSIDNLEDCVVSRTADVITSAVTECLCVLERNTISDLLEGEHLGRSPVD